MISNLLLHMTQSFKIGSTLNGNKFAPRGASYFLYELIPFKRGAKNKKRLPYDLKGRLCNSYFQSGHDFFLGAHLRHDSLLPCQSFVT